MSPNFQLGRRSSRIRRAKGLVLLAAATLLRPAAAPRAAGDSGSAGTSGAQFLVLGADARGAALGEAMGPAANDSTALYWNPAGLARLASRHASFTHAAHVQSVFYDFLSYAHPIESTLPKRRRELLPSGLGTVAAAVLYLNAGSLEEIDKDGRRTGGGLSPRDLAAAVGWGTSLTESLDLGFSLKLINSRIQGSASTAAGDAGARLGLEYGDVPVALSASLRDLGGRLRFREQAEELPASARLGASARPLPRWLLTSEAVLRRDGPPYGSGGMELGASGLGERVEAALRAGYSGRTQGGLGGLGGLSLGAGLKSGGMTLDYAWTPYGELGDGHRFSLSWGF